MSDRVVQLVWLRAPLAAARRWPTAGLVLADGHHLVRHPTAAVLAPPVALVLGLLLAIVHGDAVWSSSLLIIGLLGLVGLLGAALGLWATVGLGLGLLLFAEPVTNVKGLAVVVHGVLPTVLTVVVLGLLTTLLPLMMNGARAAVGHLRAVPVALRGPAEMVAAALTVGLGAYVWSEAAPLLIRPVFTWPGYSPTVQAIAPLQERGPLLALALAAGAAGRVLLERRLLVGPAARFSTVLGAGLATQSRHVLPGRVRAVLAGVGITVLLSGVIGSWLEAVLVLAFFVALLVVRDRLGEHPPQVVRTLLRVPVAARGLVGLVLAYLATRAVLGAFWVQTQTFAPVLVATCAGVAVITLLTIPARAVPAAPAEVAP